MIERILTVVVAVLGISLVATSVIAKKEIDSAMTERDFWRNQYLLERRSGKVTDCHEISEKYVVCSYAPRKQ